MTFVAATVFDVPAHADTRTPPVPFLLAKEDGAESPVPQPRARGAESVVIPRASGFGGGNTIARISRPAAAARVQVGWLRSPRPR